MAHRSWCSETGAASNERLEFLGDAVLGLVVTAFIYGKYPNLPEGDLAKLRASVVNAIVLAEVAGRAQSRRKPVARQGAKMRQVVDRRLRFCPTHSKQLLARSTSTVAGSPLQRS